MPITDPPTRPSRRLRDDFDIYREHHALAESQIGCYKTELIKPDGPGAMSAASRPPPWSGSTGSTPNEPTDPSTTSPPVEVEQLHYHLPTELAEAG